MTKGTQSTYEFVLENVETKEIDKSVIFLNIFQAKEMAKKMEEIVYQDASGNQWKLIKIKKT
jgi:hypothetical protein